MRGRVMVLAVAACLAAGGIGVAQNPQPVIVYPSPASCAGLSCPVPAPAPCEPLACPQIKTCVRKPDVKKITHTCYSCKVEDRCKSSCKGLFRRSKCCGDDCDDCGPCGKPRTVRRLVKKFVVEECPTTKCVVEKHDCPIMTCPADGCPVTVVVPAHPEAIPAPKGR